MSPWMVMSLLCSATMVTLFAGHALLDSPIARFPYMSDAQLMEAHEEQTAEFARLLLQQEADTRKAVAATRGSPGCSVAELIVRVLDVCLCVALCSPPASVSP